MRTTYNCNIPCICHVYTMHTPVRWWYSRYIPGIYVAYTTWYIPCIYTFYFMHVLSIYIVYTEYIHSIYSTYTQSICMVYTRIYQVYTKYITSTSHQKVWRCWKVLKGQCGPWSVLSQGYIQLDNHLVWWCLIQSRTQSRYEINRNKFLDYSEVNS